MDFVIAWTGDLADMGEAGQVEGTVGSRRGRDAPDEGHERKVLVDLASAAAEVGEAKSLDLGIVVGIATGRI